MTTAPSTETIIEYIRALPPEGKHAALIELIREGIREMGGQTVMPVHTPEGESLGYYVPPAAAQRRVQTLLDKLTPEERTRGLRSFQNLNDTLSVQEFNERLMASALETANRSESPDALP